jgi:hypothetical protein
MRGLRTTDARRLPLRRTVMYGAGGLAALLLAAGCVSAPNNGPSPAPGVAASPVPSPSPAVSAIATPVVAGANATANGAAPALPPATIDVSPAQVQVGGVTLSMAVEPAKHMLAQSVVAASDPDPAHQAAPSTSPSTAVVLDGLLRLTNNVDLSQPLPDDQPQSIIRHVNVQVKSDDGGYPVPYLSVSLDALLDGRPMASGLAVVPMIDTQSTAPRLYYGNNVKLMQRGAYQFFVRLQPSALLGNEPPATAQFNVTVR